MNNIDNNSLISMLYESLNYDHESDKRTVFEYMKQLIDQIYGVEAQIVDKAAHRFAIASAAPKKFEIKAQVNRSVEPKEKLKHQVEIV